MQQELKKKSKTMYIKKKGFYHEISQMPFKILNSDKNGSKIQDHTYLKFILIYYHGPRQRQAGQIISKYFDAKLIFRIA